MSKILEAVLTDATLRSASGAEQAALQSESFEPWSGGESAE